MIIYDEDHKVNVNNITILLDCEEANQLLAYLEDMLQNNAKNNHYHLNNEDYSKEITIALYDINGSLEHFSDKYKA